MRRLLRIAPSRPLRLLLLALPLGACLLLGSCHKQCHCYGYDNTHTFYSEEEVDQRGKSCAEMIYFANTRRFSLCEWDY